MKYLRNPPDASSLMTSARSFGNYDLSSALADLLDNSIKARARTVDIKCVRRDAGPEVRIVDDGCGMGRDELLQAMRLALLADLFPIGVVAVLQPAGRIEADGLQMRGRIRRIAHVPVGRRHRH